MKRVLMLLVACCLVVNSFAMCAFAEPTEIDFSMDTVKEIFSFGGEHLMTISDTDRASAFMFMRGYFSTDEGVDALIELIESDSYTEVPAVNNIFTIIGDKDTFIFIVKMIKCIPEEQRAEVLDNFYAREGLELNNSEKEDLYEIYSYFVSDEVINTLKEENNVAAEMIAALFCAFKGNLVLTDTEYGSANFALKSITKSFAENLDEVLAEYTIDGKTYKAKAFVNKILDEVNKGFAKTLKKQMKVIFGEAGIYKAAKDSSGGSSNGGYTVITDVSENIPTAGNILSPIAVLQKFSAEGKEIKDFDDTIGHWSKDTLAVLRVLGVAAGDEGTNNYRPDFKINREEMAVLMARYLQSRDGVNYEAHEHIKFVDAADVSPWAVSSVAYLAGRGILLGYPDGNYRPQQNITREEAAAIVERVIDKKYKTTYESADYSDHYTIGEWALDNVEYLSDIKVVQGVDANEFQPKRHITRAEVARLIYNAMCVESMIK